MTLWVALIKQNHKHRWPDCSNWPGRIVNHGHSMATLCGSLYPSTLDKTWTRILSMQLKLQLPLLKAPRWGFWLQRTACLYDQRRHKSPWWSFVHQTYPRPPSISHIEPVCAEVSSLRGHNTSSNTQFVERRKCHAEILPPFVFVELLKNHQPLPPAFAMDGHPGWPGCSVQKKRSTVTHGSRVALQHQAATLALI